LGTLRTYQDSPREQEAFPGTFLVTGAGTETEDAVPIRSTLWIPDLKCHSVYYTESQLSFTWKGRKVQTETSSFSPKNPTNSGKTTSYGNLFSKTFIKSGIVPHV